MCDLYCQEERTKRFTLKPHLFNTGDYMDDIDESYCATFSITMTTAAQPSTLSPRMMYKYVILDDVQALMTYMYVMV